MIVLPIESVLLENLHFDVAEGQFAGFVPHDILASPHQSVPSEKEPLGMVSRFFELPTARRGQ